MVSWRLGGKKRLAAVRRRILGLWLLALGLAVAGLFGLPGGGSAQAQTPFTVDVRAGYEGAYRVGEWFPIVVEVGNDGPDLNGTLEWIFPAQPGEQTFRQVVELPHGSRKRVTLDVFASGFARNGQMRLLAGATVLASQDVRLDAIDEGVFLIGVASSDPALLNNLGALQIAGYSSAQVRHLRADDLPDHVMELRGVDALFVHDVDSAALRPAQREALARWAGLGGQLVVSGGAAGPQAAAGLVDLLPVRVGGAVALGDITPLAQLAGVGAPPPTSSAALIQVQPRPEAERLPRDAGLLFRWRYGAGLVSFSTFDVASLRGWTGEAALWSKVLTRVVTLTPGASARLSQLNLLERGVLKLPSLSLPSTTTLLLFLMGYVLVIGPLNYIVLRRLRRLEWAWLTVPAIVLLFAGGLYVVGLGLRGAQAQLNQAAVVQSAEGQSRGFATAFVGLFSPRRATYTAGFPADTFVAGEQSRSLLGSQSAPVVADISGARSIDVLADVGSVTTFVAEATVDVPVSVQSNVISDSVGLRGEVRNTGTSALEDALLVRGDTFVRLGTLAPGASQRVEPGGVQQNFPNAAGLPDTGVFDRQEMLNMLFDRDAARLRNPGLPAGDLNDVDGVYLLAWVGQPTLAPTVNGQAPEQNSLTLYVIRLRAAARQ